MPGSTCPDRVDSNLEALVRSLETMTLNELRDVWRSNWGTPPKLRSANLLRMIVAWRLQAGVEGGLGPDTKARLRSSAIPRTPMPPAGTRLTREYRGTPHTVEVGDGTFLYAGRQYGSLSEVASEITGTHWNGPRFFGLRRQASR
jgi:hypothetical protein